LATSLPAPTDKVLVKSGSFDPSSAVVTAGMAVTWNNQDSVAYLIADNNQSFAFNLPANGSFSLTFTDPGTYNYHCTAHPYMQGTIIVASGAVSKSLNDTSVGIDDLISKVRPSVVAVDAEIMIKDIWGHQVLQELAGTGWILDNSGLIVTNNHVVEGAERVTVTLENGQIYTAITVRTDPINDLAVINIDAGNLQAIEIGDSSLTKVGDPVVALGNRLGQGIVATQGNITNTDSTFTIDSGERLYNVIQTSDPINHGNSGGPLINMNGQVIGITTAAKMTPAGATLMAYAISTNTAEPIIRQLVSQGYVTRAWLGVTTSGISEFLLSGYKLATDQGALVTQITANGPAEKSGLKTGDVIINLGGKDIAAVDDLVQQVRASPIGQPVKITYWRDNRINATSATLIKNPCE